MDAPYRQPVVSKPRTRLKLSLLIRRIHLYSGLFLVPWVLLYGVTAFLFNHPDALSPSDKETQALPERMGLWAETDRLADEITASLGKGEALKRVGSAQYSGRVFFRFDGETVGSLIVDLEKGQAVSRSRPGKEQSEPSPLDGPVDLPEAVLTGDALRGLAADLLAQQDILPERIRTRSVPDLAFDLDYQGKTWRARYDIEKGSLEAKSVDEVAGPHWRSFLLRLHTTHVYRDDMARFAWALIVDIMALAMMTWGATGLYMWWGVKKLRPIGKLVIAASVAVAFLMGLGMYFAMSS